MTELTLFASTFVLVFALGAQSLNVNNGHYVAAAFNQLRHRIRSDGFVQARPRGKLD